MTLPEDDDVVFETFVDWIYLRRFELPFRHIPGPGPGLYKRMVKLFVLADKYDVPKLRNRVLTELFLNIKSREYWPCSNTIAYAYEQTCRHSVMRKLFADHLACNWTRAQYEGAEIRAWLRAHPDISADVIVSLVKHRMDRGIFFSGAVPEEYLVKE